MNARFLRNSLTGVVLCFFSLGIVACKTTGDATPKSASVTEVDTSADIDKPAKVDTSVEIDEQTVASVNAFKDDACPSIEILEGDGTATLTAYANEGEEKPENTLYQAILIKTSRQCSIADGVLSLNVIAAGRASKGPKSVSNSATLPIRIAIARFEGAENKVLFSQLYNQLVSFPNEGHKEFSIVENNISVPFKKEDQLKILIGFDTIGSDQTQSNTDQTTSASDQRVAELDKPEVASEQTKPQLTNLKRLQPRARPQQTKLNPV